MCEGPTIPFCSVSGIYVGLMADYIKVTTHTDVRGLKSKFRALRISNIFLPFIKIIDCVKYFLYNQTFINMSLNVKIITTLQIKFQTEGKIISMLYIQNIWNG